MSKSFKDRPDKYPEYKKKSKIKEEPRFKSSKGRVKDQLRNEIYDPNYIPSFRAT